MTRTWPRGSEWRKWDLHIHAPGTKLNDQFKADDGDVWKEYCQRLHDSNVQAFGITDYFSADGYFSARAAFQKLYPDSDKVFFPNIELRTNDVVNKKQEEVNIHLVFNPFRPDHEDKIKSFLMSLKTNKTDGAGRHVKASELTNKSHFEEATTTRAFIREALEETYGKGAELLDYVLIVAAANNDGIRAERGKKRKLLITDEVDKFSDAFFGNTGNVEYFLSTDRAEDKTEHTEPKPVLSACDAHSLSELDERLGQVISDSSSGIVLEPTWIKSDLTFEGLKQIIFEPQNRVFIGEVPESERRVREHKTRYIESLHITCIDGYQQDQHGAWFCDEQIVLGKELVAIIGNKGSGKSAVTDIIGLLGNPQLAYLVFKPSPDPRTADMKTLHDDLTHLWNLLGNPKRFPFYLVEVQLSPTAAFDAIASLPKGNKATNEAVRDALCNEPLFDFSEYELRIVNGGCA